MIRRYAKLFRWQNLLMIAFIQYFVRYFIFLPVLRRSALDLVFSDFNFFLLVLTTVLIAAAGYLINDYFDIDRDKTAGRENFIGEIISKDAAINLYIALNFVALATGFYVSFVIKFYKIGFLFLLIEGLLWFYSQSFKKTFLVGNLIIAVLAGLVPLITLPYELLPQINLNGILLTKTQNNLAPMVDWTLAFSLFAFWLTLIREIIKDMQDFDADNTFNYRTLPIIAGEKTAKITVSLLTIALTVIFYIYSKQHILYFSIEKLIFMIIFIILPLLYLSIKIFVAKEEKDYKHLSLVSKLVMISGTLFLIFIF